MSGLGHAAHRLILWISCGPGHDCFPKAPARVEDHHPRANYFQVCISSTGFLLTDPTALYRCFVHTSVFTCPRLDTWPPAPVNCSSLGFPWAAAITICSGAQLRKPGTTLHSHSCELTLREAPFCSQNALSMCLLCSILTAIAWTLSQQCPHCSDSLLMGLLHSPTSDESGLFKT